MALELSRLSVAEIRERYVDAAEPVSRRVLALLASDGRLGVRAVGEALRRRADRERRELRRLEALTTIERKLRADGALRIAGVDEVGVGPLAGPVVAAAVVFESDAAIAGVDDSKRLTASRRAELAAIIRERAVCVGVGQASPEEIDLWNVHRASLVAMRRAVDALSVRPDHVLVDARTIPEIDVPQDGFPKGDGRIYSIAAASIVAKVHRDGLMAALDEAHPGYGFAKHKGYGTAEHLDAIRRLGPSSVHRKSWAPLREIRGEAS